MFGYHGNFLHVNLNTKKTKTLTLKEEDLKNFIGGCGLAAKLAYNLIGPDTDPLGPDNPLIFATGPFQGTTIPSASRYAVCAKSPLTGIWGEATSGGFFPFQLKFSGFDGVIIMGKSKEAVYLYINDGVAEIRNASHLWGKDTYETQETLKKDLGETKASVACIGSAGENLVKYACIINDRGRAAGRCGLGAVMGSKNLKAVAALGDKRPEISSPEKVSELARDVRDVISTNVISIVYREYGTLFYMDLGMYLADVPAKYFTKSVFPVENVTGEALRKAYPVENYACLGCPIGCGRLVKHFRDIDKVDGPEYETVAAFGPLCMNFDLDSIIFANHLCNVYGLDTISAGVTIALAMALYDKGILTKKKAGMEIMWGDGKTITKLVEMIAKREGIGDLLAEGSWKVAEELGAEPYQVAHVKGLEIPMHDPRAFTGIALSYATGPRGACHLRGDYYNIDLGGQIPEFNIMAGDRFQSEGKAMSLVRYQNLRDVFDSLILCKFAPLTVTKICELLNNVTGWKYAPKDVDLAGERSFNVKRAINNRLGVTQKDDWLPKVVVEPLKEGNSAGKTPDMELMLKDYYSARKWDWSTGKPTREKLMELSLSSIAKDLWP